MMIAGGMKDRMAENGTADKCSLKQVIITNIHRVEEKLFQGDDLDQLFPGRAGGCNEDQEERKVQLQVQPRGQQMGQVQEEGNM